MLRKRFLWLPLLLCPTSLAAAGIDEGLCRNGIFGVQNNSVGLGKISATGRTHFIYDMEGCPNDSLKCRQNSYVVAGDRVVTGRAEGKYVCVYYPSKGGGTAGWIEASRIKPVRSKQQPPLSAWVGTWSDEGNPIVRFYMRRGKLIVEGSAAWPSFKPSMTERPDGPNIGEIAEAVATVGNRAFAQECEISFTLLENLIVASDPKMQCGGANVSFTGVYRR
jgi:hypothetical protein